MSPSLYGLSILAGAGLMLVATPAKADVELAPMVVIDFSTFDGTGFAPEPAAGQLDSDDWSVVLEDPGTVLDFGGEAGGAGSDFARGLGGGGTDVDGVWAFDVDGAGLIALGVAPNADIFTPGSFRLRMANNTGAEITEFQVEYTVWINNDQVGSNSFNLMQSADNVDYTIVGEPLLSNPALDADGFVANEVTVTVTPAAPVADGSQYYIAWEGDDEVMAADRDEFGLEGITIRLLNVCGNGLMEDKEECDTGLDNSDTGACTATCTTAVCGDGLILDGTEECDDGNTDPDDGCAADCTEEAATTDTETDSDTDSDTDGSESGTGSDTDVTATGASMTGASATSPTTTSPTGGSTDTDSDTGGEDDDDTGCSCRSSGSGAPLWGMLGLLGLGLARRRRR